MLCPNFLNYFVRPFPFLSRKAVPEAFNGGAIWLYWKVSFYLKRPQ